MPTRMKKNVHEKALGNLCQHLIQRLSATLLLASAAPGGFPASSVPFALIVILVAVAAGGSMTTSRAGPSVF